MCRQAASSLRTRRCTSPSRALCHSSFSRELRSIKPPQSTNRTAYLSPPLPIFTTTSPTMPPERTGQSSKAKAFKPPTAAKPASKASKASKASSSRRDVSPPRGNARESAVEVDDDDDDEDKPPAIPPMLLTRILHECFKHEDTRISKDSNIVVSKYIEIFAREAIARAKFERDQVADGDGMAVGEGFLEVRGADLLGYWAGS